MIRFCHVSIVPPIDSTPLFRMHACMRTTHACSRLNHAPNVRRETQNLISSCEMRRRLMKLVFVRSYRGAKSIKAQYLYCRYFQKKVKEYIYYKKSINNNKQLF